MTLKGKRADVIEVVSIKVQLIMFGSAISRESAKVVIWTLASDSKAAADYKIGVDEQV